MDVVPALPVMAVSPLTVRFWVTEALPLTRSSALRVVSPVTPSVPVISALPVMAVSPDTVIYTNMRSMEAVYSRMSQTATSLRASRAHHQVLRRQHHITPTTSQTQPQSLPQPQGAAAEVHAFPEWSPTLLHDL